MKTFTVCENIPMCEIHYIDADSYSHNPDADLIEFAIEGSIVFAISRHMVKWIKVNVTADLPVG